MKLLVGAVFVLTGMSAYAFAETDRIAKGQYFSCPIPQDFAEERVWDSVPSMLRDKLSDMAPLGREWNAGDETDERPMAGVEFVVHRGGRWIVAIGHGGIASSLEIRAFDIRGGTLSEIRLPDGQKGPCAKVETASH
jgi:hypothetical protein